MPDHMPLFEVAQTLHPLPPLPCLGRCGAVYAVDDPRHRTQAKGNLPTVRRVLNSATRACAKHPVDQSSQMVTMVPGNTRETLLISFNAKPHR